MFRELEVLDERVPSWDSSDLVVRGCPVCSVRASDASFRRPDGLTVHHCGECGIHFVSPTPSSDQLTAFYVSYDRTHRREPKLSPDDFRASLLAAVPMADLRVKEIASLTKLDGAAVLDIGFGRPYFLNLVRMLGAAPYGLELDPQAIEYARHAGFQDVFLGQIETFRSPRLFDVVALLDVVEHPLDPMSLLRHSVAVLRDGGLLAIWTPNGDHHEIANDPVTFRVDLEHLQYFTTSSLGFVARKLGLEIVHIETLGHPGLQGLCGPRNTVGHEGRLKSLARKTARRLPGFNRVNRLRQQRIAANRDERSGTYHLFCILRKKESMRPHVVNQPAPN